MRRPEPRGAAAGGETGAGGWDKEPSKRAPAFEEAVSEGTKDSGMLAAASGRGAEAAAFAGETAGAKGVLETAAGAANGLTATVGVTDGRMAAGESDNGDGINGNDRELAPGAIDGAGADGDRGPTARERDRTCAALRAADRTTTINTASVRLTSPL